MSVIGGYLSPEPMLQKRSFAPMMAHSGLSVPAYSYALNNPITKTDPDGKIPYTPLCLLFVAADFGAVGQTSRQDDKTLHCRMACEITLSCGPGTGNAAGFYKEQLDRLGMGSTYDEEDLAANEIGEECAMQIWKHPIDSACGKTDNCQTCCEKKLAASGLKRY